LTVRCDAAGKITINPGPVKGIRVPHVIDARVVSHDPINRVPTSTGTLAEVVVLATVVLHPLVVPVNRVAQINVKCSKPPHAPAWPVNRVLLEDIPVQIFAGFGVQLRWEVSALYEMQRPRPGLKMLENGLKGVRGEQNVGVSVDDELGRSSSNPDVQSPRPAPGAVLLCPYDAGIGLLGHLANFGRTTGSVVGHDDLDPISEC